MNFISASIAWRYARARSGSKFLNFITLFSIGGILLGVCALIIVLSVMNGFENQLKSRILGAVPHIIVKQSETPQSKSQADLISSINKIDSVIGTSPILMSQAMIQGDGILNAVMLQGINPTLDTSINPIANNMRYGLFESLIAGKYNVIIGRQLSNQLGVTVGDKIRLISAQRSVYTPFGRMPSQRNFMISGIFEMESQVDSNLVLIHIQDAKRLLRQQPSEQVPYRLFIDDAFDDQKIMRDLQKINDSLSISSWRNDYGELFAAVNMEKNMMKLMLSLIIAVAAFNIISALVILVTEKQTDIAILSTLGLSRANISLIFIIQGTLNGVIGTIAGGGIGLLVAFYLNDILRFLHLDVMLNPVDPLAGLPILIIESQVIILIISAILLTLLATLYPSLKAGRIEPAKALKHD